MLSTVNYAAAFLKGACSLDNSLDLKQPNLVLTRAHAGNRIPKPFRALFNPHSALLESHRGYDPGALQVARLIAAQFQAPCFSTPISRLLIDCNRSLHHHHLFSDISKALPDAQLGAVIETHYRPYRDQVIQSVKEIQKRRKQVVHISVHSFTPSLNGNTRKADIGLLYNPSREPERVFCGRWRNAMYVHSPQWSVKMNYPYRGIADGFTTYLRKQFTERQYIGIELELNHGLYFDARPRWNSMVTDCIHALGVCLNQSN